ncbi:hypothetical protein [Micromonospora pallida]|uniref:hypothetical protein n=1 Tax=Micromonospora pallida TaxID=145854 RepID=UPI00114D1BA8|nr:hypothetical protein [Micromonospora pallida]
MTEQPPSAGPRRFARDIAVNVLANLIAAAVIYLLAVIASAIGRVIDSGIGGGITANRFLVAVAIIILSTAASSGVALLRRDRPLAVVIAAIGLVMIAIIISNPLEGRL